MADSEPTRSLVVEFLEDHDVACPTCLYNLRGAAGERCPECGTAVHLEMAGSTSGAFWWVAAIFGAGLATLIVLVTLLSQLRDVQMLLDDPRRPAMVQAGMMSATELPRWVTLIAVTALMVVLASGLAWMLTSRRRFARLSPFGRVTLGLTWALAPLFVLGILRLIILTT